MDIRQCYDKMGANFDKVLARFGSEDIIKRFAVKFLNDKSFEGLIAAMGNDDMNQKFRAAHTLKGVCLNLGFDNLYEVSSKLTEKLRKGEADGTDELFNQVKEQYEITVASIKGLD